MDWNHFCVLGRIQGHIYAFYWSLCGVSLVAWAWCVFYSYVAYNQDLGGLLGEDATIQWIFFTLVMGEVGLGVFVIEACYSICISSRVVVKPTFTV